MKNAELISPRKQYSKSGISTIAYKSNIAHNLVMYGLQAENGFHILIMVEKNQKMTNISWHIKINVTQISVPIDKSFIGL